MASQNEKRTNNPALNAALYIIAGLLLFIFKTGVLDWAMTAIGAVLVVVGIMKIVKKEITEGIITAVVGAVVILGSWLFLDFVLLILGVAVAVKGVLDLVKTIQGRDAKGIVAAIITAAVGVMLFVGKWALMDWLFMLVGVLLVVDGILVLNGKKKG